MITYNNDKEAADALKEKYAEIRSEISKVIVGQEEVVDLVITSIFCHAHSLLIGVPGLAKTLLVNTLASSMSLDFNRVQFTPDLMPSDILGAETLDKDRNFQFIKGPIFNNVVLADEINRTPPKTQAALLEAMQEKKVTVSGKTYSLPNPFFVLATQNPIEQEGTYPLPEAQLDRFMFNINLIYPSYTEEVNIVKNQVSDKLSQVQAVIGAEEIIYFQSLVDRVPVPDNVVEYAVKLVHSTRPNSEFSTDVTNQFLEWGAGPRASQFLIKAAKCQALFKGKYSPDIEEVKSMAIPILRHRLVKNFKADAQGYSIEKIIEDLL